jgi:hypothetical protein
MDRQPWRWSRWSSSPWGSVLGAARSRGPERADRLRHRRTAALRGAAPHRACLARHQAAAADRRIHRMVRAARSGLDHLRGARPRGAPHRGRPCRGGHRNNRAAQRVRGRSERETARESVRRVLRRRHPPAGRRAGPATNPGARTAPQPPGRRDNTSRRRICGLSDSNNRASVLVKALVYF